jgi:hypothetical protein
VPRVKESVSVWTVDCTVEESRSGEKKIMKYGNPLIICIPKEMKGEIGVCKFISL